MSLRFCRPKSVFNFALFAILVRTLSLLSGTVEAQQQLPYTEADRNSTFAQIDFAEMYMNQANWEAAEREHGNFMDQQLVNSDTVSALDLQAPSKAVKQFNRGVELLKNQNSKDAIRPLQKAISIYPSFVSAHIALGYAYFDEHDRRAKDEFKTASILDDQFPVAFLNLGVMELMAEDPAAAVTDIEKAASLTPKDPKTLMVLAFAQNGAHQYRDVLKTVERVHALEHPREADVHYIAAAAAGAVGDTATMKKQLQMFVEEDPANPLVHVARKHLDEFASESAPSKSSHKTHTISAGSISSIYTFPNSERLHSELASMNATDSISCNGCGVAPPPSSASPARHESHIRTNSMFTIHQAVDETALFLAVSRHGRMVNDLAVSDIRILDDNKSPDKILQFIPQSRLPLRLGLLIDISGSVQHRFQFEQNAARKFIEKVLNSSADLAFVAGFSNSVNVTQDFTRDASALQKGIQKLNAGGDGTSLFDAIDYSCWKLAAYPDEGRVAKVLVVLTDGEDNSSHRSLKQSIESADAAGVTVYTINTSGVPTGIDTDANKVLQVVAERSGGESVFPASLQDLERYLSHLPDVIRSRYLIAYKPAGFLPNGKYRAIRVNASKDGKKLQVHTRKGYYARLEAH